MKLEKKNTDYSIGDESTSLVGQNNLNINLSKINEINKKPNLKSKKRKKGCREEASILIVDIDRSS